MTGEVYTAQEPRPSLSAATVQVWRGDRVQPAGDTVAVEEPLEIRVAGCAVAVTMRTPGDDLDLAAGFLLTEGIIHRLDDIASLGYCPADDPDSVSNIVNLNPVDPQSVDPERWRRAVYTTSSCGICGRASLDRVRQAADPIDSTLRLEPAQLYGMALVLQGAQRLFGATGGLHAAALFDREGTLTVLREDVGRHNAVDKVIGSALRAGALPLRDTVLVVSSRGSFEIVQKALIAGIPVVAAVSAPSSLAVTLAQEMGVTLVGFLRPGDGAGRFNVYAGSERIVQRTAQPVHGVSHP